MISFAEVYDHAWITYRDASGNNNNQNNNTKNNTSNHFKTDSLPLYSVVNGFYINKTGNYNFTIEYQPQKWFIQGGTISIVTAIIILVKLFVGQERIETYLKKLSNWTKSYSRTNVKN